MKDFREAAEKYEENLIRNGFNQFEQGLMLHGYKEGYSEAKKEVREFYLNVREMLIAFNKSSLTLGTVKLEENVVKFCAYKHEVLKSLASFTEQEQKEL